MIEQGLFVSVQLRKQAPRSYSVGRQFLVTDYQASIMSNLVAMTLTLAGPRLWILIKRFAIWLYDYVRASRSHHTTREDFRMCLPIRESGDASLHSRDRNRDLEIIEESHSELSASIKLITDILRRLRPRIELPSQAETLNYRHTRSEYTGKIMCAWNNTLRQPMDIIIPFLLSIAFVAIFVAGSAGSVLSAGIVSDTTALASSRRCFIPQGYSDISQRAFVSSIGTPVLYSKDSGGALGHVSGAINSPLFCRRHESDTWCSRQ